ncbi:phosphopantetheine-binding protein [Actinosynnema sp. NPDC047251]|uniref:Acyl carrier protein n=1 Tax=Saccharothrix espanaensis (strain ATCC 51144 / DSM 44229 / JCM 9112 / NBRC 15066 / NRRL 15764) TaxID=1179773 RepID=K0JZE5_SACES|nr:phosphopantetheine-binding protein [Saccharothrix espanaensis]CCH30647.1 Acyl carrier protein [Saccharothrix espanaensis DSM 44229]
MSIDPDTVSAEFVKLLSKIAEVPEEKIHAHSSLKGDLDVDSLAIVELFDVTEAQWGVKIPDEDAQALATVGEIVDYLRRRV